MEFLQHDFITIKQGVNYYGFSERPFLRMKLIDCSEDCIVFEYIDDTLSEILRDTVRCIRNRYGQIILEAYNHCAGGNFKYIEIRYE